MCGKSDICSWYWGTEVNKIEIGLTISSVIIHTITLGMRAKRGNITSRVGWDVNEDFSRGAESVLRCKSLAILSIRIGVLQYRGGNPSI